MELLFGNVSHLKNKCGIYLLKIQSKLYIGSSISLSSRLSLHRSRLRRSKHENCFLQSCFNKYGDTSCYYSILELCNSSERLLKEKFWIDMLGPELNLKKDPVTQQNCITTSKNVYQYSLSGKFLKEFPSAQEAGRVLDIDGHVITKACSGKYGHKSYRGFMWSFIKCDRIPVYTNRSSKAKIKSVTMYSKRGDRLCRFNSVADAARYLLEPSIKFDSLCAKIAGVAKGVGILVNGKYRFSYQDLDRLPTDILRNFSVDQVLSNGLLKTWDSVSVAARTLGISQGGIRRVINGERKSYKGSKWRKSERV